jgi:hypothetical protein
MPADGSAARDHGCNLRNVLGPLSGRGDPLDHAAARRGPAMGVLRLYKWSLSTPAAFAAPTLASVCGLLPNLNLLLR